MCNSGLAVVRLENSLDFKELSQLITQKLFKHSSCRYHQHLAHCHGQWLYSRKPGEPKYCYNTAAPHWVPKTVATSGALLLLAALNPIKNQGWWKEKFAYFQRLSKEELGVSSCSKASSPPRQSVGKSFFWQRERVGTCRNSTVDFDSHLEIGHVLVWSASSWLFTEQLICSSTISLFPFFWGQFLELWYLMSWLQPGHHVINFYHLVKVLLSVRQLIGYGWVYYL